MTDELYSLLYLIEMLSTITFQACVVIFMYLYIRRMK